MSELCRYVITVQRNVIGADEKTVVHLGEALFSRRFIWILITRNSLKLAIMTVAGGHDLLRDLERFRNSKKP